MSKNQTNFMTRCEMLERVAAEVETVLNDIDIKRENNPAFVLPISDLDHLVNAVATLTELYYDVGDEPECPT